MHPPSGGPEAACCGETGYRHLFENLNDAAFLADPETGILLDANPQAEVLLGRPRDEIVGMHQLDLHPPAKADEYRRRFAAHVAKGRIADYDGEVVRKDGAVVPTSISASTVTLNRRRCVLGLFRDITERKQAEEAVRESREQLMLALDAVSDGVWDLDYRTGTFQRSDQWYELVGYGPDELVHWEAEHGPIVHPHDRDKPIAAARRHERGEAEAYRAEFRMRHGSGEWRWFLGRGKIVERGANGEPLRMVGTDTDITERKRAEEALRESERKYRDVVEMASDGIAIIQDGLIKYVNPRITEIIGYSAEELIGKPFADHVHPDELGGLLDLYSRRVGGEHAPDNYESTLRHKNGSDVPVEITGRMVTYQGEPADLGMVRDVTERKRADEALKRSEREKAAVLDNMSELVAYQSPEMRIRWANRAAGESVDVAPEHMVGRYCYEVWHAREEPCVDCPVVEALQTGRCHEGDMTTPDGRIWHIRGYPVRDASGNIEGVVEVTQDVTEPKRAQEALRQSEELLRRVIDADPSCIFVKDKGGRHLLVNKAEAELYGTTAPEMIGKTDVEFAQQGSPLIQEADDFVSDDMDVIESKRAKFIPEESFTLSEGTTKWFQTTKVPLTLGGDMDCVLGVAVDITERKRAERERHELELQIQHAQKLESLGVLAGGVAHDFNNLLAGILGNADLALLDLPESSPARGSLEEIKIAGARASDLTRQMLAYAGRGQFAVSALDLNKQVNEVADLLRASVSKKASITFDLAEGLGAIEADAAQVQQVIVNLVTNASDAIGDRAGAITVRTRVVSADRAFLSRGLAGEQLPEGRYVLLEVTDTGPGIDAETRAKVFDPFFTTKFAGRGLGLAAVLGIVRSHGGTIMVESEPGTGTTFTILFPCSTRPVDAVECEMPTAAWHGTGTVLVVDDEQLVSGVATRILEHAGFSVLVANRAPQGVDMFQAHADEIVAVLLDMTMPEMGGAEVYHEIRRVDPDVPVILTSGYNEQDAIGQFAQDDLAGFIHKPFELDTLVAAVRQALER